MRLEAAEKPEHACPLLSVVLRLRRLQVDGASRPLRLWAFDGGRQELLLLSLEGFGLPYHVVKGGLLLLRPT